VRRYDLVSRCWAALGSNASSLAADSGQGRGSLSAYLLSQSSAVIAGTDIRYYGTVDVR